MHVADRKSGKPLRLRLGRRLHRMDRPRFRSRSGEGPVRRGSEVVYTGRVAGILFGPLGKMVSRLF